MLRLCPLQDMLYYRVALSWSGQRYMTRYMTRYRTRYRTRCLHLEAHRSADELARRWWGTTNPVERSHWRFLWLLARGCTATAIASRTGYSAYWITSVLDKVGEEGIGSEIQRGLFGLAAIGDEPSEQVDEEVERTAVA